jgi:deoxyribodipyrimidine photolyase-related protein
MTQPAVRHLIVVLGDQLDADAAAFDDFDPMQDAVWMAETTQESTHVPSSKNRSVMFLSAMRHFALALRSLQRRVCYQHLDDAQAAPTLSQALARDVAALGPQRLIMTEPGEWRVLHDLRHTAHTLGVPLEVRPDRHFMCSVREFAAYAKGRKQLRLEGFYRHMRQRHDVLMHNGEPIGGQWNFDKDNRGTFGAKGPGTLPAPTRVAPDAMTQDVMQLVQQRMADHPGDCSGFAWPVTRAQALLALQDFVQRRLPHFGAYQDAMWEGQVWLYHAHLSAALNLKLLRPREVIDAAVAAYNQGHAPLQATEGFVRQILGWREYVRGIYWTQMPDYATRNALDAHGDLPAFYWSGNTDMACLADAIGQTLRHGYAHHIQRLMVTGLYALLLGVRPQAVHQWYLAMYVDAVEWVELPNTLGMSQYADGGVMASKPYAASGAYIKRMSNHCKGCRYDPSQRTGQSACPFTTLYWDFLLRHQATLQRNPRMALPLKHLANLSSQDQAAIQAQAHAHRQHVA